MKERKSLKVPSRSASLFDWSLYYHRKGIKVVKAIYKGKHPPKNEEWKIYKTKLITEVQLEKWFGPKASYSNISAITGPASGGLTVLDFDSTDVYERWQRNNPELSSTLPKSRSSRGYHVFLRSSLSKDDTTSYAEVHIKAGGLVSLPPSMHKSDVRYEWIIPLPEKVSDLPIINPYKMKLGYFPDGNDGKDGKEGTDGKEGVVEKRCVCFQDLSKETREKINEAIERTLPKAFGQRYNLLFLFCRWLKKIDEIKEKTAEELIEMGIANMWYERALSNIGTKSLAMTKIRFAEAWEDAKYPPGEGKSLQIAWENALKSTKPMVELEQIEGDEVMEKLIRLCFELQVLAGPDDEWFIPTNKARELFNFSHSWLGILLKELCKREVIKKTREYTAVRCSRYKFIGPSLKSILKQTA